MNYNKYGSLTETFMGDPLLNILMSAKATPPADMSLVLADFTDSPMYASVVAGLRLGKFSLGEVPRITGIGIWCNMADGLVQIDNPDSATTGLELQILASSYNLGNVQVQANVTVPAYTFKVQEFNQIYDIDYQMDMSTLNYALTGVPKVGAGGYFRLFTRFNSATAKFSTISIDPLFAAKRFIMRPMLVVEHTYPLFVSGF